MGSKVVKGLLFDDIGGLIREDNLDGGGHGIFGRCGVWSMKVGRWLYCHILCCREGGLVGYEESSLRSCLTRWGFWARGSLGGGGIFWC